MNQVEFAQLHGVSKKTVTAWKNKGWVVLNADGTVDVGQSNKNLERYRKEKIVHDDDINLGVTQLPKVTHLGNWVTDSGNNSEGNDELPMEDPTESNLDTKELLRRLTYEKLKSERERARAAEYDTAIREGQLLESDKVRQHDAEVGAQLLRKLTALPSELAVRLAAINSPSEVESMLREEITYALNEFLDAYEIED